MTSHLQAGFQRSRERGGIVILVALMLLALLAVAAFGMSRTVLREVGISGNVYQAARADTAADAGLDWFMAWENDAENGNATPAAAAKAKLLTDAMKVMYKGIDIANPTANLSWTANASTPDGMVLQGTNVSAFDLSLVCLGKEEGGQAGAEETNRGNPSGGTNVNAKADQVFGWEATSTGQAILPGDAWRFRSVRAGKVVIRPKL